MARRDQFPRPLQRAARLAVFALVLVFGASGLANAELAAKDATSASFHACAGAPVSLSLRLQALNEANWKIADDTPATREYFGLVFASGYGFPSFTMKDEHRNTRLAAQNLAPPLSAVLWRQPNGQLRGAEQMAGKPVDIEAVVTNVREHGGIVELFFTFSDVHAILQVLALPLGENAERFHLFCNLFMAEPLDLATIAKLLPADVKPADLRQERAYVQHLETILLSYRTTSGFAGKVTYLDATTLDLLQAHRSRIGSKATISTILNFDSLAVPLNN